MICICSVLPLEYSHLTQQISCQLSGEDIAHHAYDLILWIALIRPFSALGRVSKLSSILDYRKVWFSSDPADKPDTTAPGDGRRSHNDERDRPGPLTMLCVNKARSEQSPAKMAESMERRRSYLHSTRVHIAALCRRLRPSGKIGPVLNRPVVMSNRVVNR